MIIATGFCMILGYTFSLMGRVCLATGSVTHKECGERSSGPRMAQIMSITLLFKTAGTCLSYAIVIGDSFSRILHYFGCVGLLTCRQAVLVVVVVGVLVPLCLQRDLSVLSYTSLLGLVFEVLVVCFMQLRYLDGSYAPGGKFYSMIDERYAPVFDDGVDYWGTSITTFVLLGNLSSAFIAHYNAPKFFSQMKVQTVSHFNSAVTLAFLFSLMIYLWIMAVGYLTFGTAADGLILNNYAESDWGATVARAAIGFAVVFGFPLAFTALRDSTISTFNLDRQSTGVFRAVTFCLLLPIASVACFVRDLGLVNSLLGAFFGGMIVLAYPGLLTYFAGTNTPGGKCEFSIMTTRISWTWVILGFVMSTLGSSVIIVNKYAPDLLA
mmetsp:Transcript_53478/g.154223  ORF Transcript_53478/g.154223 Transcript_53478/m.154223 type:complete len:381 (+) Transcript_53478:2-1144(+)